MSAFVLKLIAIFSMVLDHLGYIVYNGSVSDFTLFGRIAFPIFAFQISEGYTHTNNLKKYFIRLFVFALISQIPFMLFENLFQDELHLNVFFTLFLGLLSIFAYDKINNKFFGILIYISIGIIAQLLGCDYGFYGVTIILFFFIFRNNIKIRKYFFIFVTSVKYIIVLIMYNTIDWPFLLCASTCFSIFFINRYNGKKGKNIKYLPYFFYPIHFIILYGIYKILY